MKRYDASERTRHISSITLKRLGCPDAERQCPVSRRRFEVMARVIISAMQMTTTLESIRVDYNPNDFTDMVEQINKQGFFELATGVFDEPTQRLRLSRLSRVTEFRL